MNDMPEKIWAGIYCDDKEWALKENPGATPYIRADIHESRVSDLLEANNRYLERARLAEAKISDVLDIVSQHRPSTRDELPDSHFQDSEAGREEAKAVRARNDGFNLACALIRKRIAKIAARKEKA